MALTRKFLAALGIEAEKIDEIISAHAETVEALKKERDEARAYKVSADKLPEVQKELDELKAGKYREKYEKEHEDFEAYKADVNAKATKAKKTNAFKKLLKDIGVSEKRIDAIVKVSAIDDVALNEDETVKDSDVLKENLKKEWADFIEKEQTRGVDTETPPPGGAGGSDGQPTLAAQIAKRHYESVYGKGEKT